MKQRLIMGGVVMAILFAIFFATKKPPVRHSTSTMTIRAIKPLGRVEITHPKDAKGEPGTWIALERRDDSWWMVKPVESPINTHQANLLDAAFEQDTPTDDIRLSKDKAVAYKVDDAQAIHVALFPKGLDKPQTEVLVGKTFEVPNTRVKRTFIRPPKQDSMYRLQADLSFLREPVNSWRDKSITRVREEALRKITIKPQVGETIVLERKENKENKAWSMTAPPSTFKLHTPVINTLTRTLKHLEAQNFVDEDKSKADVLGLAPPQWTIVAELEDGNPLELHLGHANNTYYARNASSKFLYEISTHAAKSLILTPLDLKSKRVATAEKEEDITQITCTDGEVLRRVGDTWESSKKDAQQEDVRTHGDTLARTLTNLNALRFAKPAPKTQGLRTQDKPDELHIKTSSGARMLRLGKTVTGPNAPSNARFAAYVDQQGQEVFILDAQTLKSLHPAPESK